MLSQVNPLFKDFLNVQIKAHTDCRLINFCDTQCSPFKGTVSQDFLNHFLSRFHFSQRYLISKFENCVSVQSLNAGTHKFLIYGYWVAQLCFPCNCWYFSQSQPGPCPRFNLGIVSGSTWELSQLFMVQERTLFVKNHNAINVSIVQWLRCLLLSRGA